VRYPVRARSSSWFRIGRGLVFALAIAYLCALTARVIVRRYYIFLPDYALWEFKRREPSASAAARNTEPTHIFFLFVDHFEPNGDRALVRRWIDRYVTLADRHRDSRGRVLQHTWFYPGEQESVEILQLLREPVAAGYGEVEMHLHHFDDTESTLRRRLSTALGVFQQLGYSKTIDGRTAWAFIHGNNGLDNSTGELCGVSTELRLLHDLGCFADFTFPSVHSSAQPPVVNRIYMAKDDSNAKSYARALPLDAPGDLTIFEGPLIIAPAWTVRRLFLDVDDGNIHAAIPPSPTRVDRWVSANVHVPERPDWIFVKVFGHTVQSAGDMDSALGAPMDEALAYLEHRYNDGTKYLLHYVTAREAYNLVRAAAAGSAGNPDAYLDATINRYVAGSQH
jgi:hypothetical protein